MIIAAREAGDLKDGTGPPEHSSDGTRISTLADYGISRDLAALSVLFAKVPDEVWVSWHDSEVEPHFETYQGADPDGYALTTNLTRRHLSTGARAIIAAQAARLNGSKAEDVATGVAENPKSGINRISEANLVIDFAPELVPQILADYGGDRHSSSASDVSTLSDYGISRDLAALFIPQRIAR
jgi:hypothetical protein